MNKGLVFKPRARLLLQLGDQLIRNESIALLELVKNSYDADASTVIISMKNVDKKEIGEITIEDDGIGMDRNIIENVWMEPGSDYKERKFKDKEITPKYGRLPIGEKGIGRFGVHKLGKEIELVSRIAGKKEVYLLIDWEKFKESHYLYDVPINLVEREPVLFLNQKTGTKIFIRNLQVSWTRAMIRDVYRSINSLNSPFKTPESFTIKFTVDSPNMLEGLLKLDDIRGYALYRFKCKMTGNKITKFAYEFTPWPTMNKLKPKIISEGDEFIKKTKRMVDNEDKMIDLSKYEIGEVYFEGLIYDRTPRILNLGVQDRQGLKKYLNRNGGIRVYRDGVRVYDYGEPENDWLSLDIRRVNLPGKRISNNIIIGAVNLNRKNSTDLTEKTNREGFIENNAYLTFVKAILYSLNLVETLRKYDKDKLRLIYGLKAKTEPVIVSLEDLRTTIEKNIKNDELKKNIEKYLDRIESEYYEMNEVLLKSAGAGLSLTVALHEIEKIISELKRVVEKHKPSIRILNLVERLFNLVEAYGQLTKGRGKKNEDLIKIIENAIFSVEYRLEVHHISLIKKYTEYSGNTFITCERSLITSSILNIFDNSIWWLEYYEINKKKIQIDILDEYPGYLSIIISDNGHGFTLPPEEIIKPFVSGKPYGMGIGLHIVKEILEAHGGILQFPEPGDIILPKEFKNGATIVLSLKRDH